MKSVGTFYPSYANIIKVTLPLMVFHLSHNVIGIVDTAFLGQIGTVELSAGGLYSIFYLILIMFGYGISRGAQIIIARRLGEREDLKVGQVFRHVLSAELIMGIISVILLIVLVPLMGKYLVSSEAIKQAGYTYMMARAPGLIFTSLVGAFMALYVGIGKTNVIGMMTVISTIVNIILDYVLIFGHWGFEPMGIVGAAVASFIAEFVALLFIASYTYFDQSVSRFKLFHFSGFNQSIFSRITNISIPIIVQHVIGVGGWLLFFSLIEQIGEIAIAGSIILKNIYTFLLLPAWSLGGTIHSFISNLLGVKRSDLIPLCIKNSIFFGWACISVLTLFAFVFQATIIGFFTNEILVFEQVILLQPILIPIFIVSVVSVVVFNTIVGAGATKQSMIIETIAVILYLVYALLIYFVFQKNLFWIWSAEMVYFGVLLILSMYYLKTGKWKEKVV